MTFGVHLFEIVDSEVKYLTFDAELFCAGMNTGIQDVHNLAWKIASVVQGTAPKSILTTYEAERRPVWL